jgi:hypothetical protein
MVWTKRVTEWRASGQSPEEFAGRIGVHAGTLINWHYKLRRLEAAEGAAPTAVEFVELPAAAVSVEYEAVEVVLPGGARLRVPSRFDEAALRRLVAVLERRA